MRKIGILAMGVVTMLATTVNVSALTKWSYEDWSTSGGADNRVGGSKSYINDDNTFINLKGSASETEGMKYGPRSTASKAALKDSITEEAYISLKSSDYNNGDLFELTVDLSKSASDNTYVNESVIMTQKGADGFVLTSNNDPSFRYVVEEDGIYTYRWKYSIKDEKILSTFTLLKNGEELATTSKELENNNDANLEDVVVRYFWACNIKAEHGIDIYTGLPSPEVSVQPSSGTENLTVQDENFSNTILESLKGNSEFKDITDDVTVNLVANKISDVNNETAEKFKNVAGNGTIAELFDIQIYLNYGSKVSTLPTLSKPITLSVALPELPEVKKGTSRVYYVLRMHDGEVEKLDATLSEDGKSISFETDKFSEYAIAYEDVKDVTTPQTFDGISMYMTLAVISLLTLTVVGYAYKKKSYNN